MGAEFLDDLVGGSMAAAMPERRAALVLHSMAPHDRAWMLERLPVARRAGVQELLDELDGLGVPAQPALLRAACVAAPAPPTDGQALQRLGASSAACLLAGEPDGLIAAVLCCSHPEWRDEVLGRMGARRRGIEARMRTAAADAPALAAALTRGLASRARTVEARTVVTALARTAPRLQRWLPGWLPLARRRP